MAMKVREMAKYVGVSPATISLVLNNKAGLSDVTRKRVTLALQQLGIEVPKKSSLQSKSILFVVYRKHGVEQMKTPFFSQVYSQIIEGVERQVRKLGLSLKVFYLDEQHFSSQMEELKGIDYEGMLLLATEMDSKQVQSLEMGKPIVLLDAYIEGCEHDCVVIQNQAGVKQAIEYLKTLGHSRIGYLHVIHNANNFTDRYFGFLRAMEELDLPLREEDILRVSTSNGGEAVLDVLRSSLKGCRELPTAFFADNDIIALYAIKALKEINKEIPEEISLIGFDNVGLADLLDPPLTTIDTPKFELGQCAVNLLSEQLSGFTKSRSHRMIALMPKLVVRASTSTHT